MHWKGYDASHGRWVSRTSLAQDVPGLVAAYERSPSSLVARRSAPKHALMASATQLVVGGVRRSPRVRVQHLHWLGGSGPVWDTSPSYNIVCWCQFRSSYYIH